MQLLNIPPAIVVILLGNVNEVKLEQPEKKLSPNFVWLKLDTKDILDKLEQLENIAKPYNDKFAFGIVTLDTLVHPINIYCGKAQVIPSI